VRVPLGEELRTLLGAPTRARLLPSSPRSRVWQVELGGVPAIVKQVTGGADPGARYAREVSALRLAARVRPAVAPALLATDDQARVLVLVLERLDFHRPGPAWVVDYAEALARLHAATGVDDVGALPAWAGPTSGDVTSFLGLAKALDVPVPPAVPGELDALLGRLDPAGRYGLLHGDPCPGNDLHTGAGVRFVDFEQAALGNGLIELAYLRIGFPTCWCATALPETLLADGEAAYRRTWRAATGTEVAGDLADACAAWLIRGDALVECAHRGSADFLARVPVEDWTWGPTSARERLVHRLGVVSTLARDRPALSGVGTLTAAMRQNMLSRWPRLRPLPAARPAQVDT